MFIKVGAYALNLDQINYVMIGDKSGEIWFNGASSSVHFNSAEMMEFFQNFPNPNDYLALLKEYEGDEVIFGKGVKRWMRWLSAINMSVKV